MKPERWQQIDQVFHEALAHSASERPSFLDQVCAGDESLRKEVESLLAAHAEADKFIESPALEVAPDLILADDVDSASRGPIGHYSILRKIGAGGMGEVYLAEDSRLGRKVALKILPDYFTRDQQRVGRFQLEARTASALNHPNILTIHEIGRAGDVHFMATEYIEGETLRHRLGRGLLPLPEAIDIAVQIAGALEAAHHGGIIHRDIKPENIMLRPDGYVKVLDFGLAKLVERSSAPFQMQTGTPYSVNTDPGTVMGTATYMSPEQARGQPVDTRTDIFSLGVVAYEMIACCVPFQGPTPGDVIAAILEREPPLLSRYAPQAPSEIQRIVEKAISKAPEGRYQTIREMLNDLKAFKRQLDAGLGLEASRPTASAEQPRAQGPIPAAWPLRSTRQRRLVVATAVAVTAVVAYYLIERRQKPQKPLRSLAVLPFKALNPGVDEESLGLGLADDLVTRLSSTRQIIVTPTVSTSRFSEKKDFDPVDFGRSLGVDAVLIGTVQRAQDRIRFNAQLVRTEDRAPLWADKFDERAVDILTVQDRLSERLAEALALQLNGEQERLLTKRYTRDAEAFQLYMNGYYYWKKRTPEGFNVCADYYRQALRKDPGYALAYAGLAATYSSQSQLGFLTPNEAMPQAEAAARRAIELDDKIPAPHVSLAMIRASYDWDLSAGEAEFQKAIDLDSDYLEAHQYYGLCLAAMGRFDECRSQLQIARRLDPTSPVREATATYALYLAGDYDDVIGRCKKAIEIDPTFYLFHLHLGHALGAKRMYDPAIAAFQKARILSNNASLVSGRLGYAYAASGRKREARQLLDELQQTSAQPHFIAQIYIGLDEPDRAMEWLQKAYRERSGDLIYLKTDPIYRRLDSHPKFIALQQQIGLSPHPSVATQN